MVYVRCGIIDKYITIVNSLYVEIAPLFFDNFLKQVEHV
jgi:hypothetical protein